MAATERSTEQTSCPYVVGGDALAQWPQAHSDAWIGLLEVSKRLSRELDGELESRYGIGLSSLELLGRLAAAPERRMSLSTLAEASHLSLSRVSRIVDALQGRSLVERRQCPRDARSVEAQLTDTGFELAREAQATHHAAVEQAFFAHVDEHEIATLAAVFARLAPGAAAECSGGS